MLFLCLFVLIDYVFLLFIFGAFGDLISQLMNFTFLCPAFLCFYKYSLFWDLGKLLANRFFCVLFLILSFVRWNQSSN